MKTEFNPLEALADISRTTGGSSQEAPETKNPRILCVFHLILRIY